MNSGADRFRAALRSAAQASQSMAISVTAIDGTQRSPDWLRLLNCRVLTDPEIASGIAVPRRLRTPGEELELTEVLPWLKRSRGKTFFLKADAGEGKSTYLNLISNALAGAAIVLTWRPGTQLYIDDVLNIVETARSMYSPESGDEPSSLPVLILSELRPHLNNETMNMVLSTLHEHELRGDEAIFLIAGRPGVINLLVSQITGAEICSLAPINAAEASALCIQLEHAYAEVLATVSLTRVAELFPNLPNFVRLSLSEQSSYFLLPEQPLIVGFLKAIYGNDFVQRLVGEYRQIENDADRLAYLHVCLATMSGVPMPEHFLRALVPAAAIDKRSNYDPWVRTNDDAHMARHALIAQTVIEGSKDYTSLSQCFEQLMALTSELPDSLSLLFDIATEVAYMRPFWSADRRIPARIRKRFAAAFMLDENLLNKLLAESTSASRLFSWANLLASMPSAKPSSQYVDLYETAMDLLRVASELTPQSGGTLSESIEYRTDCAIRDLALATNEEESIDVLEDRIVRWRDFIDRPWPGPHFYADLFDAARDVAIALTFHQLPDRDSDSLYDAYLTAALAWEHLDAMRADFLLNPRYSASGELFRRHMYYALPSRYVQVWEAMWKKARYLHTRAWPGIRYAESLLEDRSRHDQAIATLLEVLDHFPCNSECIYALAKISSGNSELSHFVRSKATECTSLISKVADLGMMHHAAAMVEEDAAIRQEQLEKAVDNFAKHEWNAAGWDVYGESWIGACAELKALGYKSDACGQALRNVRSRLERGTS